MVGQAQSQNAKKNNQTDDGQVCAYLWMQSVDIKHRSKKKNDSSQNRILSEKCKDYKLDRILNE